MAEPPQRQVIATEIQRRRVSAIIRTDDQSLASDAMDTAVAGGFTLVEFTLTIPGACELIAAFSRRAELIVGAGTVLSTTQAREAVAAGARFLVSPVVDDEVIAEAAALDVPSIPGACTPTEMVRAHRCGADFVKLFPAPAGGADFVRAVRGPLPQIRLFPTAGVDADNFTEFLDAGCAGVGFVRSLFDPGDLRERNFDAIRARGRTIIDRLQRWNEG